MNELMQALGGPPTEKWEPLDVPPQQVRLSVTVTMAEPYFRAIAKVAFHYTLKVFPELTGREGEFNRVRNYIWSGTGGGLDRPVKPMNRQFWGSFRRGERPKCWTHLLTVERAHDCLTACVQLFAGPEVLPFPFLVELGTDPARIVAPRQRLAHVFTVAPVEGFDGVMEEAAVTNYILPVGFALNGHAGRGG